MDALRRARAPFLLTRIPVLIVGYAAVRAFGLAPVATANLRLYRSDLLNLPARWDALWYYTIAAEGYRRAGDPSQQQTLVFFPLYPFLMRTAGVAVAHQTLLAGLAISIGAFLAALVFCYRLARLDADDDRSAFALMLIATYPFAIFFSAPYTESLFLLEMTAALYYMRVDAPARCGSWALAAGLTRPNGCTLAAALASMALTTNDSNADRPRSWRRPRFALIAASVMPIAGAVIYSLYLRWRVGDAFGWITGQAAWGSAFASGAGAQAQAWAPNPDAPLTWAAIQAANLGALALAAIAIVPVTRRFGAAYGLAIAGYLLPALATHGLKSIGRFTAVLFPIFLWLAIAIPPAARRGWIVGFAIGQAAAAALFFTWRPLV
jgi:hypothetical protein